MTLEQAITELKFKDEQIAELARQNEALTRTVEQLRGQIALLQRRLYGPRSEKYHPDQLHMDGVLKASESLAAPAEDNSASYQSVQLVRHVCKVPHQGF